MLQWNNGDLSRDVNDDWMPLLSKLWDAHGLGILNKLNAEYKKFGGELDIYPAVEDIFRAFKECSFKDVKVVIIGQDCYINPGEAHGLAFSVARTIKMPPSLRNIFKEIQFEYGGELRSDMNLTDWARQGVLLLNTALTVRHGCSGSHMHIWKDFTCDLMKVLGSLLEGCVFMLWGNHAQEYSNSIDGNKNMILKHSHPSPLSRRPFVGNNHFKTCNEYLRNQGKVEVLWHKV